MNILKLNIPGACLLCLLFIAGCSPATEVTGTWSDPQAQNINYDNVLVFAMTDRVNIKESVENALAEELRAQGVNVTTSLEQFPPRFRDGMLESKDEMMEFINQNRYDGILTVAVVDEETETRYIPGGAGYAPMGLFGYYGGFWPYYSNWAPMYQPGYYEEDRVYFLETNLYDAETEKLIWSAQSETTNPGELGNFSNQFSEIIVDEMTDRNLFSQNRPATTAEADQ